MEERRMRERLLGSWPVAWPMLLLAPCTAWAAEPAILYIPTEPVTLRPTGLAPCGSAVNSALGCGGASEQTEEPPYANAAALTTAMTDGLAAYDVLVTNTRPPEYVSYVMLLPSEEAPESESFTCVHGGISCGARKRNTIVSTSGATTYCMDPEITHAAMYAFGRASGLEGVANPEDWMNYPPNYAIPPLGFQDVCSDRVNPQGFDDAGTQIELPLECTSVDHAECPDDVNGEAQQNGHQDLLLHYGERTEDTEPPVLANVLPQDGAVLQAGEDLVLDVEVVDADPVVGVRWVIASPALEAAGVEGGALSQCTNDVCDGNWEDATPLKATSSDWSFTLTGLPEGEYVITLEAADYHGNVAETVTLMVTIGAVGTDESGSGTGDSGTGSPGADDTVGVATYFPADFTEDGGADDSLGSAGAEPAPSGCGCRSSDRSEPASPWLLALGWALRRRRRSLGA